MLIIKLKDNLPYSIWEHIAGVGGKAFSSYGGYRVLPLKSPPSHTTVVPKFREALVRYLTRYDYYGTDPTLEWTKAMTQHGNEIGEYLTAYDPLFVQEHKGMDYIRNSNLEGGAFS